MTDVVQASGEERSTKILGLTFTGSGGQLFGLYLKNILLSIVTLGIYSFWGKVEISRYIAGSIDFHNGSFGYHATGKEKFLAFLKGIGMFIAFFVVLQLIGKILGAVMGANAASVVTALLFYAAILLIQPLIAFGSWRFLLGRSSWRNVRFHFSGDIKTFTKEYLKGMLLTVVTLGIYSPFFTNKLYRMMISDAYLGNRQFNYKGDGKEMFMIMLKGVLLSMVTFGIYSFWMQAELTRYVFNNTDLGGDEMECTITGGDIFGISVGGYFMVLFSMGIAMPWVTCWALGEVLKSISIAADPAHYDALLNVVDPGASAMADGVAEAADALEALSGMF